MVAQRLRHRASGKVTEITKITKITEITGVTVRFTPGKIGIGCGCGDHLVEDRGEIVHLILRDRLDDQIRFAEIESAERDDDVGGGIEARPDIGEEGIAVVNVGGLGGGDERGGAGGGDGVSGGDHVGAAGAIVADQKDANGRSVSVVNNVNEHERGSQKDQKVSKQPKETSKKIKKQIKKGTLPRLMP